MTCSTPAIRISQYSSSSRQRKSSGARDPSSSSVATAVPMAIPHAREAIPPPLPPPQYLPEISQGRDPGWQWANNPNATDFARPASVKPGSSLLGGSHRRASQERDVGSHARRTSSVSVNTREVEMASSEEDVSMSRPVSRMENNLALAEMNRLQSERRLERTTFEGSSHAYDKQLLSRIGGPNTPGKQPNIQDISMIERERRNSLLPALGQSQDGGSRWLPSMSSGSHSPRVTNVWEGHAHTRHNSIQDDLIMDDAQQSMPRSAESDGNFRTGAKRRASSPPRELHFREERSSIGGSAQMHEVLRRNQSSRDVPSRFHASHASVSSVSSYGGPRHGSLSSSLGIASVPSSATSYGSGLVSPLATTAVHESDPKPEEAQSHGSHHQLIEQRSTPDASSHSRHGSRSQTRGTLMCECCPKKPKKFENEEELRSHEAEKQYGCMYCSNRFKNKNEAERHQNSLHLRRHSWSCAALAGYEAAFHSSMSGNNVDICGYCGENFPTPADWPIRIQHLETNHKFGQCNQVKKFFRADHFRQHLKHSHDGTSGKWTNMLENACMKDEPPPIKLGSETASLPSPFASASEFPIQRS